MGNNCCKVKKSEIILSNNIDSFHRDYTNSNVLEDELILDDDPRIKEMNLERFRKIFLVGKGGFSKVWKVELKDTQEIFAMKIISKKKYMQKNVYLL